MERIVPEGELVVAAQAEAEGDAPADQKGGPGPARDTVEQKHQQNQTGLRVVN